MSEQKLSWPCFMDGTPVPARKRFPDRPCRLCIYNRTFCYFHGGTSRGNTRGPNKSSVKELKVKIASDYAWALHSTKVLKKKTLSVQVEEALDLYFKENPVSKITNGKKVVLAYEKHRGENLEYFRYKKIAGGDLFPHPGCNRFCGWKRSSTGQIVHGCQ